MRRIVLTLLRGRDALGGRDGGSGRRHVALLKREEWGEPIAAGTPLDVEVRAPAVTHRLTIGQIQEWYDGVAVSPDEVIRRRRVRALIE